MLRKAHSNTHCKIIELTEFVPVYLPQHQLSEQDGRKLWTYYSSQITIQFPTIKTDHQWILTAQGWVGFIPLSSQVAISLNPKVPLANLFGMLEYTHDLKSFRWQTDLFEAKSLDGFYTRLALLLAQRVIQRCRQGIYREYLTHIEPLPYVRGSLALSKTLSAVEQHQPICCYEEQSADIEDNQILTWALHRILQSNILRDNLSALKAVAQPAVRRAYRQMRALTTLKPYNAQACQNRRYHRLNADYEALHGLSAFFLADSGPSHEVGGDTMVPFLVDMARLYERFVANWLQQHMGADFRVQAQERQPIGNGASVYFNIDLTIYDTQTGQVRWVMDTKYKSPMAGPAAEDIAQAIAYAQVKGAPESILIYPLPLMQPLDVQSGEISVQSLIFGLAHDLEEAGSKFLAMLFRRAS